MDRACVTLIACTVCLACSQGAVQPSAPVDGVAHIVPGAQVLSYTDDGPHSIAARVAAHVPEFGGVYVDGQGYLTVYLTDFSRGTLAQRTVRNELLATGRESPGMRLRHGRFSFADLWRWKTALRPLLTDAGVVVLAVDERANRVRVETSGSTVALARQIQRYHVPLEAVEIERVGRAIAAGSVDDGERPAVGGLRISGFFEETGNTYTIHCSYGVNVRNFADTVHRYMVTASHCVQEAPPAGGYVGANVYQPDTTDLRANLIGSVVKNPSFMAGGTCPVGGFCRASDAALVRIAPGVASTLGAVARPVSPAYLPTIYGPRAIDPTRPTFALSGYTEALVGDTVSKVGASTGWTAGVVTAVCADINLNGYIRTCSGIVSAGGGLGDSGAPVMYRNARNRYYIAGMVFGINDDAPDGMSGHQYYFSTWQAISDDLAGFPGLGVR